MVDEQVMSTCFLVSAREKSIALLVFYARFCRGTRKFCHPNSQDAIFLIRRSCLANLPAH